MKKQTPFQAGINKFLKRMGLSQRKLGEQIGKSNMAVSQWALGKHEPKVGDLDCLIDMGMTAAEIFGENVARTLLKNSEPNHDVTLDEKTMLEIKKNAMQEAYKDLFKEKLLK